MRDNPWIILGLICWPLALLLHLVNDDDKAEVEVQAEPLYQFEVLDRGDVYVVDYGLTLEDCRHRLQVDPKGYCRQVKK